jgi:hypothetical protein
MRRTALAAALLLSLAAPGAALAQGEPAPWSPLPYTAQIPRLQVGVGAPPPPGAEILFDGSRATLDDKWTYWQGPRFSGQPRPIEWKLEKDPAGKGMAMSSYDPVAAGRKFGSVDIVTKKAYRDVRVHVEFLVQEPGGNSGVYLQNRYELQINDGDATAHGMAAFTNETPSPYFLYRGLNHWNAYDIVFRAARFEGGKMTAPARASLYFNGVMVQSNHEFQKVWGGANSGIDGGNDEGKGITDSPGGLKLQSEGAHVLYRNIWIQELDLKLPQTMY